jgi:hypothetical protein
MNAIMLLGFLRGGRSVSAAVLCLAMLDSMIGVGRQTIDVHGPGVEHVHGQWSRDGRPMTGTLIEREAEGGVVMIARVANGVVDGAERRWFSNGRLESVRTFAAGRKAGVHEGWWPDGTPRFRASYHDDAFDGVYEAWHRTGTMSERREFLRGHEEGRQQMWMADGTLFVNYEMRNGRRFGMVNAKPCLPVGEDQ